MRWRRGSTGEGMRRENVGCTERRRKHGSTCWIGAEGEMKRKGGLID